jgi:glycyl-tRNA synthetase beta chain
VSETLPLLLEVGCEEIPARFLSDAERSLGERVEAALSEGRLLSSAGNGDSAPRVHTFSTPRRLVAYVPAVLTRQPDHSEEVLGPPVRVAFDQDGRPTRAAEAFAAKNGVAVADLARVTNAKGSYLAVTRVTRGSTALELLSGVLPGVITGVPFPKSMYWTAKSGPRFVRPIRWIVAVLGEGDAAEVIPFAIAGLESGASTRGHRTTWGPARIHLDGLGSYVPVLREAGVEVDPAVRRERLRSGIGLLTEGHELVVIADPELETWMVNSLEWPRVIMGSFDEKFLELPREILITVMRDHQKYFAVEDREGKLRPRFVASLNLDSDPKGLIRAGHERVLKARFADAQFFWDADQKMPLHDRVPLLDRVTYHEKLGSYADKVRRMTAIANAIRGELAVGRRSRAGTEPELLNVQHVLRAVELCKCDLTTHMVQEFTELQGVVGGLYARIQGQGSQVADAIYDHYKPVGLDDSSPRNLFGAIVALADKFDAVVMGFAAGLDPTGSSDPFALRRAGNGIIKIIMDFKVPLRLMGPLFSRTVEDGVLKSKLGAGIDIRDLERRCAEFFREREDYYLRTAAGIPYDTARAVLAISWTGPFDRLSRATAIQRVRGSEDFDALTAAAKRIKNILAKSATSKDWQPGEIDASRLEPGPEAELYKAYLAVHDQSQRDSQSGGYESALRLIAGLRPPVDRFFDRVLVMDPDPAVRQNRLRFMKKLDELFSSTAELSEIVPAAALPSGQGGSAPS